MTQYFHIMKLKRFIIRCTQKFKDYVYSLTLAVSIFKISTYLMRKHHYIKSIEVIIFNATIIKI